MRRQSLMRQVVFDLVASPVKALGTIGFLRGIAAARNDGQGAFILDLLTYLLAVVGLVGGNGERRLRNIEHIADDLAVMDLAPGDGEVQWLCYRRWRGFSWS